MPEYMQPFTKAVLQDGTVPEALGVVTRRLSDLRGLFADAQAEAALSETNPLVYEVHEATDTPAEAGHLRYSTTVIRPGRVGDEYFMTRGHYHALGSRAELYYGLRGEGYLLLQTPEGAVSTQPMTPGAAAYVPPYWGHRTVNTGEAPFAFLAVYPADAGYDYGRIAETGFAALVVARGGKPDVVPNPRFRP